jgi:hypothetical protein
MANAEMAEVYFIAGMFVLIMIISAVAVYYFFKTYNREKLERQKRLERKQLEKTQKENAKK